MKLTDFAIKNSVFSWSLMLFLMFFGAYAFTKMDVSEFPNVTYPNMSISYEYLGASPEVMERDVLIVLEGILAQTDGIRFISGSANRDRSSLDLELFDWVDVDKKIQEIATLLAVNAQKFPSAVEGPSIRKSTKNSDAIMYIGIRSKNLKPEKMVELFKTKIQKRLTNIDGVADIEVIGIQESQLNISLNMNKMKQLQLTPEDISQAINSQHEQLAIGVLRSRESSMPLSLNGRLKKIEELKNVRINRRGGAINYSDIRLKNVAKVERGFEDSSQVSTIQGVPAITIKVQKSKGSNAVNAAKNLKHEISLLNAELNSQVEMEVVYDATTYIRQSIEELLFTLILASVLTGLVCWLFMESWSSSLNVFFAIPTSILGTFIFLKLLGFSLNNFTLLGIILAIGIVVDDAIVMVENIESHARKGLSSINAAFRGSREISFAVIATTLAVVSIFIPIQFLEGLKGRYFMEFAVAFSVAVSLSSLEALTLAPMRCAQFLNVNSKKRSLQRWVHQLVEFLGRVYASILNSVLQNRKKALFLFLFALFGIAFSLRKLPTEIVPAQDKGLVYANFYGPENKTYLYMQKHTQAFESELLRHPDIKKFLFFIGGPVGSEAQASAFIVLKPKEERSKASDEIADELRAKAMQLTAVKGFVTATSPDVFFEGRSNDLEMTLLGQDPEILKKIIFKLTHFADSDPDVTHINASGLSGAKEITIVPNRKKAQFHGVDITQINRTLSSYLKGNIIGSINIDGSRLNMVLRGDPKDLEKIEQLKSLSIRNKRGELVKIENLVRVEAQTVDRNIYRENGSRGVQLSGNVYSGVQISSIISRIRASIQSILPKGYTLRFKGNVKQEINQTLLFMMWGILVAYLVLASQFNSFIDPLLIFASIPFSIVGSAGALMLTGNSLNLFSAVGILLTAGIVMKNGILIVEFTNQLRDQGLSVKEAIRRAASDRFRPILMTNVATLVAAIPAALSLGPGSEIRVSMALTVLGGICISLLFTLFMTPALYQMMARKRVQVIETQDEVEA